MVCVFVIWSYLFLSRVKNVVRVILHLLMYVRTKLVCQEESLCVCVCVVLLNWVACCGYGPCRQTCLCESGYIINISAYRPQNVAIQQLINPTCKCMYITFGYRITWRVEARKGRVYLCVAAILTIHLHLWSATYIFIFARVWDFQN
jgi:hypothetical protein